MEAKLPDWHLILFNFERLSLSYLFFENCTVIKKRKNLVNKYNLLIIIVIDDRSSYKGRTVNALALGADEGRDKLR